MVKSCCVSGCLNKRVVGSHKRFYRFPKGDKERLKLWVKAIGREGWEPGPLSRVCSDHFIVGERSNNKSSPNYVPTIFPRTTMSEKRRLVKLYDNHCRQVAERLEKINITTVMLSTIEEDLAQSWCSNVQGSLQGNSKRGTDISSKAATARSRGVLACSVNGSGAKNCEVKKEIEDCFTFSNAVFSRSDQTTQTIMEKNFIKCLEDECCNLRSELGYFKGKFVFKDIQIEMLRDNDEKIKYLTGLESYCMLQALNDIFSRYHKETLSLTGFQQLLMALMRMRLDVPCSFLGIMFNVDSATITHSFIHTIEVLFGKLVPLLILWPSSDELKKVLPPEFEDCDSRLYVVDCFEFQFRVKNNENDKVSHKLVEKLFETENYPTHTSKKQHHSKKYFLVIAPQGSIIFVSKGRNGNVKDRIVATESGFFKNVYPRDIIVMERLLDIEDELEISGATVVMSNSVKSRILSEREESGSSGLVRIRWTTHLLKQKYQILEGRVPLHWLTDVDQNNFTVIDKIVQVSCALFNMSNKVWSYKKFLEPLRKDGS